MKLSLIQLTVGPSFDENFKKSQKLINQSLQSEPDFILFPEHFLFLSNKKKISYKIMKNYYLIKGWQNQMKFMGL